jgi:prephenate dehydratase
MKIAIQGELGSFSHEAVLAYLGKSPIVTSPFRPTSSTASDRKKQMLL